AQAQQHVEIRGMALRAGREADVREPGAVRGGVREPVHPLVVGELLDAAAVGPHPEQLRVTGRGAAAFGVEVDPGAVGRELGAVVRELVVGEQRGLPAGRGDGGDVGRQPGAVDAAPHGRVHEGRPVGADAVEEVKAAVVIGDPGGSIDGARRVVNTAVLRGGGQGKGVGVENVVVVKRLDCAEVDPPGLYAVEREVGQVQV